MFRKMRRFKQEVSNEKCIEVLKQQPRGVLSLTLENGYPYGIPMNHWYDEETGHLYFHGAKEGQKIDSLSFNNKVSYCVMDEGYREGNDWPLHIHSIIVFGQIHMIEDEELKKKICTNLCRKFTNDEEYIEKELDADLNCVLCLELIPDYMSGKLVKES
jgi:uncharacterized protein